MLTIQIKKSFPIQFISFTKSVKLTLKYLITTLDSIKYLVAYNDRIKERFSKTA